jgi:hypothetical protein
MGYKDEGFRYQEIAIMKLKPKLILLFSFVSLVIMVTAGDLLYNQLQKDRFVPVRSDTLEQLRYISFALNIFINEVENDVGILTQIEAVCSKSDGDFTNFTSEDEKTLRIREEGENYASLSDC